MYELLDIASARLFATLRTPHVPLTCPVRSSDLPVSTIKIPQLQGLANQKANAPPGP